MEDCLVSLTNMYLEMLVMKRIEIRKDLWVLAILLQLAQFPETRRKVSYSFTKFERHNIDENVSWTIQVC